MHVQRSACVLLASLARDGKLVVFPLHGNRNGILPDEADSTVPVEQLLIVSVDGLLDGSVEIESGVAHEGHVVAQHVLPVGFRSVAAIGYQNDVFEVDLEHRQIGQRIAHRADIRHVSWLRI